LKGEQILLATYYSFKLPDGERFYLVESYCKYCRNKSVKIISSEMRRFVCAGCGRIYCNAKTCEDRR